MACGLRALSKYAGAYAFAAGGGVVRKLCAYAAAVIVAARAGPDAFGELALAFGVATVLFGLADFGLRQIAWREVLYAPESDRDRTRAEFVALRLVLGSLVALAVSGTVLAAGFASTSLGLLFAIYSVGFLFNETAFAWILGAAGKFLWLGLLLAFSGVVELAGVYWFVRGAARIWAAAGAFVFSYAVPTLLVWFPVLRSGGWPGVRRLGYRAAFFVREGVALSLAEGLTRLSGQASVLVAGFTAGASGSGLFRAAHLPWVFLIWSAMASSPVLFSRLSAFGARDRLHAVHNLWSAGTVISWTYGAIGVGLAWSGPHLVNLLYAPGFADAGKILRVLAVALPVGCGSAFLRDSAPAVRESSAGMWVSGMVVGTTILLGIPLGLSEGALGVAWAVVVAEVLGALVAGWRLKVSRAGHPSVLALQWMFVPCALIVGSLALARWGGSSGGPVSVWIILSYGLYLGGACLMFIRWRYLLRQLARFLEDHPGP